MRQAERMTLINKLVSYDLNMYEGEMDSLVKFANDKGFSNIIEYYLHQNDEKLLQIEKDYFRDEDKKEEVKKNLFQLGEIIIESEADSKVVNRAIYYAKECIENYMDDDVIALLNFSGYKTDIVDIYVTKF